MLGLTKRSNRFYIGDVPVTPKKITIAQWEELFDTIDILPQLILNVITAPASERAGYAIVAAQQSFKEIVAIVSLLTGIERDYIREHASLDDIIAYLTEIIRINDFSSILKNVSRVLTWKNQNGTGQDAQ